MFSKSKLILSAFITIISVLTLSVALSGPTNTIIIHHQQQEALATQGDTREPTTSADCGELVDGLVELNSDLTVAAAMVEEMEL